MTTRWILVAVAAAMLAGCGEQGGVRPPSRAETPATSPAPSAAPVAVTATPPASACPTAAVGERAPKAPEPRRPSLGGDEQITVRRLVIAQGVKDREPVGLGATFRADARKIYAFVEVENARRVPSEIEVEFEPPGGGEPHGDVTLAVGAAPHWRTWAYTRTAHVAGAWTAVVKNRKGDVLARAPFEVVL